MAVDTPARSSSNVALMALAIVAPSLLAYNVSPSATLLNQLLAVFGWGLVLAVLPMQGDSPAARRQPLWVASAGLFAGIAWSLREGLPTPLAWSALGLLAAAVAVAWHGLTGEARRSGELVRAFHW